MTTKGHQIKAAYQGRFEVMIQKTCSDVIQNVMGNLSKMTLWCDATSRNEGRGRDSNKALLWVWRSISERLHGEFTQRAEHQKGVFLQDVREPSGVVGSLQGLGVLGQDKKLNPALHNTSALGFVSP